MIAHRLFLSFLLAFLIISTASSVLFAPVHAAIISSHRALILSSVESLVPSYYRDVADYLGGMGYAVTILLNRQVTVNVLTSGLSQYDIVYWRTAKYDVRHVDYWFVGEFATPALKAAYQSDFAAGSLDGTDGIVGASVSFFDKYFTPSSMVGVKLLIVEASDGLSIAMDAVKAGATAAIYAYTTISLQFGTNDYWIQSLVELLSMGYTVQNALWTIIEPYLYGDAGRYGGQEAIPPFWYYGQGNATI